MLCQGPSSHRGGGTANPNLILVRRLTGYLRCLVILSSCTAPAVHTLRQIDLLVATDMRGTSTAATLTPICWNSFVNSRRSARWPSVDSSESTPKRRHKLPTFSRSCCANQASCHAMYLLPPKSPLNVKTPHAGPHPPHRCPLANIRWTA